MSIINLIFHNFSKNKFTSKFKLKLVTKTQLLILMNYYKKRTYMKKRLLSVAAAAFFGLSLNAQKIAFEEYQLPN